MPSCRNWAVFFAFTLLLSAPAFTQTTGIITGTITDTSGAVIPDARVVVRNMGTAEERVVETNTS